MAQLQGVTFICPQDAIPIEGVVRIGWRLFEIRTIVGSDLALQFEYGLPADWNSSCVSGARMVRADVSAELLPYEGEKLGKHVSVRIEGVGIRVDLGDIIALTGALRRQIAARNFVIRRYYPAARSRIRNLS